MGSNKTPDAKGNSRAAEERTNRTMAKHEREQRQQITDDEHREIMDRLRNQYGTGNC